MSERNRVLSVTKTRRITFGSTISASFTIGKSLDWELLDRASEFWRHRGLSIKKKTLEKTPEDVAMIAATLVAEGGTIWTIEFDQYRKVITVSMIGTEDSVEVFVRVELFGGFMSAKDKEKSMSLLEEFQDQLSE